MGRISLVACCWIASALLAAAQNVARPPRPLPANLPETNPYASAADVEIGRRLYNGRCGHCHGQDGEGGRGAVLNSGRFRHGGSDRDLFVTIRNGIPNTEMPGAFNLPEIEVWRMVAHVQQLGRRGAAEPALGDPSAGARVYEANGCATCHRVGAQGGFFGPDLTDIGARRAARHLRESILAPNADIPLDYRTVTVTDGKGTVTSGIHLNEDEYSVHLREPGGRLRSFSKRDVAAIALPRESLMPAYSALPAPDVDNLVAYLSALRPKASTDAVVPNQPDSETWTFDRLENIGGHKTAVLGEPRVIDSPVGRAVQFDGVDDALIVENHPLAGAAAFTWEAIFRPDGGPREQRWFHLSETDPATGADADNRMLFEIRVVEGSWFLDSHAQSGAASKTLMNRTALHPLGAWYHVASVYDGKEFSNYVDGVRQGGGEVQFAPHRAGRASIGMRINRVFYFKGAVREARFTRRALAVSEFLKVPPKS